MRPSHRLDLVLVPTEPDTPVARGHLLMDRLRDLGAIGAAGRPGPNAARWTVRFSRVRIEDAGRRVLWSNGTGGFQAECPARRTPIRGAFEGALAAWRADPAADPSDIRFPCPACGGIHALTDGVATPPIAFGRWGVVTVEVDAPELTDAANALVAELLGPVRAVWRRGG